MDIQNLLNSIQIIYNRKESINTLINPSLYDDIKNSLNNSLTDEQKHKITNLYINFLNYFAGFLLEYQNGNIKKGDYIYHGFSSHLKVTDYLSKVNELNPKFKFYFDCWKKDPRTLYQLFYKFLNSPPNTYIPSEPHITQKSYEDEKIQASIFDDGIAFFSLIIQEPLTDANFGGWNGTNGKCLK